MDYLDLAMTYGGFTRLDRRYLEWVLSGLSDQDKLTFITPPPSVINAYFAEIYQKQGPKEATAYFFDLSCHLDLFQEQPSFAEEKPFIRLNLAGKSYGFCYQSAEEVGIVFSEEFEADCTEAILFDIAQLFPHYQVRRHENQILLEDVVGEVDWQILPQDTYLLTEVSRSDEWFKIAGLNQEEVLLAAADYAGAPLYASSGRMSIIYKKY